MPVWQKNTVIVISWKPKPMKQTEETMASIHVQVLKMDNHATPIKTRVDLLIVGEILKLSPARSIYERFL
jgi:hypothetical protein